MAKFVGALKCRGGWAVAELDVRRERRAIKVTVERSCPRGPRLASPSARTPILPEDCYARLQGGRRVLDPRRTLLGRKERWKLVQVAFPGVPVPRPPRGMSEADLLDALILAWAAQGHLALIE